MNLNSGPATTFGGLNLRPRTRRHAHPGRGRRRLSVTPATIKKWQRRGLIAGRRSDVWPEHLYHPRQSLQTGNNHTAAALGHPKVSGMTAMISAAPSRDHQPVAQHPQHQKEGAGEVRSLDRACSIAGRIRARCLTMLFCSFTNEEIRRRRARDLALVVAELSEKELEDLACGMLQTCFGR